MSNNLSEFESSKCPVCLDIPAGKVFQCINKHVICYPCLKANSTCPNCGVTLIGSENQTRHYAFEKILDSLTFPCANESLGCKILLKRGERKRHAKTACQFGEIKTLLCKEIGFRSCPFQCSSTDTPSIVEHFKSCHKATIIQSSSATIRYSNFQKILDGLTSTRYVGSPVIFQRVGHELTTEFLILPISSKESETLTTCSWVCIFLGNSDKNQFRMDVMINSSSSNCIPLKWSSLAYDLENCGGFLKTVPHLIPWSLLNEHYCHGGDLLVDFKIQQDAVDSIKANPSTNAGGTKVEMPIENKKENPKWKKCDHDHTQDGQSVKKVQPPNGTPDGVVPKDVGNIVRGLAELSSLREFELLPKSHPMWNTISKYVKNSSGLPEANVKIHGIAKAKHLMEAIPNLFRSSRMLLWYKTTPNSVHNLAERADRCIVFYDRVAKAFAVKPEDLSKTRLRQAILLCSVNLGTVLESNKGYSHWSEEINIPKGFDSIKGIGRYSPLFKENLEDGPFITPCGATVDDGQDISLNYNEYMVFERTKVMVMYSVDIEINPSSESAPP